MGIKVIKHTFLYFFAVLGILSSVQGQTNAKVESEKIINADWEVQRVNGKVLWKFHHFGELFDSRQSVTVFEVDLSDETIGVSIPHVESGFVKTSEFSEASGATVGINGSFFNTKTGGSVVFLKNRDSIHARTVEGFNAYRENAGFSIHRDGSVAVLERPDPGWESLGEYSTVLTSGPLLIKDNALVGQKDEPFNSNRHPRTAIGITADHRLIAVVVDGRNSLAHGMSIPELAILMKSLGCTQAMNLDGGGSSTAWVKGHGVVNHPSDNKLFNHEGERAVANAICIVLEGQ